jgi:hypothetical protein
MGVPFAITTRYNSKMFCGTDLNKRKRKPGAIKNKQSRETINT